MSYFCRKNYRSPSAQAGHPHHRRAGADRPGASGNASEKAWTCHLEIRQRRELDAAVFERRSSKNKGYGNETTLPDDVTDMETACQVILSLCETVGARLRQDNMKISVVGVHVKDNSFTERSRQTSLRTPTNSTNLIYEESRRLFRELWDGRPLRLIGVFTSKAEQSEYEQLDLFQTARNEKQEKLDKAIDQIRKKIRRRQCAPRPLPRRRNEPYGRRSQ